MSLRGKNTAKPVVVKAPALVTTVEQNVELTQEELELQEQEAADLEAAETEELGDQDTTEEAADAPVEPEAPAPAPTPSTPSVTVATPVVEKQPTVRVKLKDDLRTHIGDTWYTFKKGIEQPVPLNVKDILKRAGMLEAL